MSDRAAILAAFGITENELAGLAALDEATDGARAEVDEAGQRLSERCETIADDLTALLPADLHLKVVPRVT